MRVVDNSSTRVLVPPPAFFFAQESGVSSPLQIVFVSIADLPEGGGNTTRLKMLATALANRGHRVCILNEHGLGIAPTELLKPSGYIGPVEYCYIRGSVNRHFGLKSMAGKLQAVASLARLIIRRHRFSPIDVLWFNNLSFYDTWPLTKLAQNLGIRTIQSYEDERLELLVPQQSLSTRLLAANARLADHFCPRMADAIVVISEYLRKKYSQSASDDRVHLIPTIVDCRYWSVGREPVTNTPTLLYAGCFGDQDEMENLVCALALLRNRGYRFRTIFLGTNRDLTRVSKLRSEIDARGLGGIIEVKGFVPLEAVKQHIAESNILLNIRRNETWSRSGFATKLSEYLASARAVVCTALGDVPRYLEHGRSAFFVPPTTTASQIAKVIEQALKSPERRYRIGQRGREVARQHFDIPAVANKLDLLLDFVLNRSCSLAAEG